MDQWRFYGCIQRECLSVFLFLHWSWRWLGFELVLAWKLFGYFSFVRILQARVQNQLISSSRLLTGNRSLISRNKMIQDFKFCPWSWIRNFPYVDIISCACIKKIKGEGKVVAFCIYYLMCKPIFVFCTLVSIFCFQKS